MLIRIARLAFGVFFLGSAALKLVANPALVELLESTNWPYARVFIHLAATVQAAAGIALLVNRMVVPAALSLVAYVAIVNCVIHPFWMFEGEMVLIQFQLFSKNAGIMAGLLALAGAYRAKAVQTAD